MWSAAVRSAVEASGAKVQAGRFEVRIEFRLPEPVSANEARDLDNLIKPTLDAMAGVFGVRARQGPIQADDERVDRIEASKRRVEAGSTGATIEVWVIDQMGLPAALGRPFFAYAIAAATRPIVGFWVASGPGSGHCGSAPCP